MYPSKPGVSTQPKLTVLTMPTGVSVLVKINTAN